MAQTKVGPNLHNTRRPGQDPWPNDRYQHRQHPFSCVVAVRVSIKSWPTSFGMTAIPRCGNQPPPCMHQKESLEMHPRHSERECLSDREYRLQRGNQPLHTPSLAAPAMHLDMLTAQSTRAKGELDNGTIVAQASHAPARSHPFPGFWSTATASQTGYGLPHKQHSHSRLSAATSANTASVLKTRRS